MDENRSAPTRSTYDHKPDTYFAGARHEMLRYVPSTSRRVLEVGCGEGFFGHALKQMSAEREVWGIEINRAAAESARTKLDRILTGDVESVVGGLPESYFDCVVFNDVLEHLIDPEATLRKVRRNLAPGGLIVCSIPNVRYFPVLFKLILRKEWRYVDSGVLDRTHLRFFTVKSIREMFAELDFEIVTMDGINRTNSLKYRLATLFSLGFFSDCRNLQYACVVRPS